MPRIEVMAVVGDPASPIIAYQKIDFITPENDDLQAYVLRTTNKLENALTECFESCMAQAKSQLADMIAEEGKSGDDDRPISESD